MFFRTECLKFEQYWRNYKDSYVGKLFCSTLGMNRIGCGAYWACHETASTHNRKAQYAQMNILCAYRVCMEAASIHTLNAQWRMLLQI